MNHLSLNMYSYLFSCVNNVTIRGDRQIGVTEMPPPQTKKNKNSFVLCRESLQIALQIFCVDIKLKFLI